MFFLKEIEQIIYIYIIIYIIGATSKNNISSAGPELLRPGFHNVELVRQPSLGCNSLIVPGHTGKVVPQGDLAPLFVMYEARHPNISCTTSLNLHNTSNI